MATCWNCNTEVDSAQAPRCAGCNKLQPLPAGVSHFDVLGLPESFSLDGEALESAYRQKSSQVHPDRFARSEAKERRISVERTAAVNEAYRALKHPESRAIYMVTRAGVSLEQKTDPAMLMELMEAREQADESAKDKQALVDKSRAEHAERVTLLGSLFQDIESRSALKDARAMQQVAETLIRLRYLARLLEDLQGLREHGAMHPL